MYRQHAQLLELGESVTESVMDTRPEAEHPWHSVPPIYDKGSRFKDRLLSFGFEHAESILSVTDLSVIQSWFTAAAPAAHAAAAAGHGSGGATDDKNEKKKSEL